MKKYLVYLFTTVISIFLLSTCVSQSMPESTPTDTPEPTPTYTLEPTVTSEPSATSEPTATQTPEYCGYDDFQVAMEEILQLFISFNDQVQIFSAIAQGTSTWDYQDVLVEVSKLQRELTDLEVPGCMDYLKQILDKAMSDVILAGTYIEAGNISEASVKVVEATTQVQLFSDESSRLMACYPNCEP